MKNVAFSLCGTNERRKKISTSQHRILKGGMQEGDVYCGASSAILHQTFEIFFFK